MTAPRPGAVVVEDPARLAALRSTGLLDTEIEEAFDRLTRLAVRLLGMSGAFISLVDANRDFYKSTYGFDEHLSTARELTGPTFCHLTIRSAVPLVIPDTRADARYRDIPTVQSLDVAAYVGIPLLYAGEVIGAFCAVDRVPHDWTAHDVASLAELAAIALGEIELRVANRQLEQQREELERTNQRLQDDATELEAQSEALAERSRQERASHHRLETILSSISDAFFTLDHSWRFTYVNDRAEQVLGRSREGLIGRTVSDVFADAVGSTFEIQFRRAMDSEQRVVFEEFYPPLQAWLDVRAYPWSDGLTVYAQDVTVRHEAEAQREESRQRAEAAETTATRANAAKSEFLATMSHELRTPLNAILGYTNLLELEISGAINAEQRLHLTRLRSSSEHLLALVNDVLDLSKLEAGEMSLASDLGSAHDVVAAAVTLLAPMAASRGIRLSPEPAMDEALAYVGDDMRARQIVTNLVSNAVKFTERGGEVRIATALAMGHPVAARLTGEGPWACISVRDTGVGIDARHQALIFEPFRQVESGRTRSRDGTGLGLAISRRLARQMGGDIVLESELGAGSTFTLWLPAAGASGGVTETGAQRSTRARRHAPDHRVHGLAEIGRRLRDDLEQILEAVVTRVRAHRDFHLTVTSARAELEDHTLSFLANVVQSLIIVDETGGVESSVMHDGMDIQRFIARAHGAQRARLGWTEALSSEEYSFLEAELAERIQRLDMTSSEEGRLAAGIVARLLSHARDASIQEFRVVRAAERRVGPVGRLTPSDTSIAAS